MADAICVPAVDCCGEAGMKFDVPACRTAFLAIVEPQIERSRCDGHEWDPPALDECIAVTKEANEMCLPSLLLPHALSDRMEQACGKIAKGELENPGAACESNLGCHAGEGKLAYCVDDLTIPGGPVCRLTTVVDEGEPCAPPDVVCKLGLACDGTCRPVASVGEACIEAVCDNGTWCVGGICALPKVSGEPCENNTECQYWCGATGVCGGGPGDACSTVADCFGTDCLGGKCAGQLGDAAWFSACEL